MPRRGGRTLAVRSASPGGRRKVRRSAARGAGNARQGESSAQHEAQGADGVREARDAGRWVHPVRWDGR
jgi:hypothetical protein